MFCTKIANMIIESKVKVKYVVETYVYYKSSYLFKRVSHNYLPLMKLYFYMILKIMSFDR